MQWGMRETPGLEVISGAVGLNGWTKGMACEGGGSSASARDKPSRGTNSPERIAAATRSRVVGGG